MVCKCVVGAGFKQMTVISRGEDCGWKRDSVFGGHLGLKELAKALVGFLTRKWFNPLILYD